MAEWFVGPIMEKLMEKLIHTCSEYLKDQSRWQIGMKKELERLRENHPKIQAIVSAASQAQMMIDPDSPLNKWIWQLRDAIDEADDVLDDFEYIKHEEWLARNKGKTKVRSTMSSLKKIGKRALKIDPNLTRLQEIVQKLDRVSAEVSNFHHLLENTKQEQRVQQQELQKNRERGSLIKNDLIGRGKEKEFVIQWLMKPSKEENQTHTAATNLYNNISLLSIVGHGGIGKTALLQHVHEDEITKQFDPKMWVCVSTNFDVKKVLTDMLECLQKTRPSSQSLDTLQNSLKSELISKKFLLVLDDIWEENEEQDKSKWEDVLAPCAHGGLGSKILITTRMNSVASMIAKVINKKNEPLMLEGLKEDECLQLLNTHAFADVENPNVDKKLRSITEKLVKKLSGSPLAAKVMGGVLNSSLDEIYWTNVLNNVLGYDEIFSILKLSYIFLPKYLQNCFAFCSIFPQDHVFYKDDLIQMWIGVGFIQPSNNRGEDVEDIGRRNIDMLVKKSFFDKDRGGYKIHDLLHDLAQFVSKQECFRVMHGEELLSQIPETIRHLSVETSKLELLKKMGKFKKLRTLCITYDGVDNQGFVNVLTDIFEVTGGIRLLSINVRGQKMVPETIGRLKHLRYLNLYFSNSNSLPRSVSNLYHLQFLICKQDAWNDNLFPRDMNNLSNLRFLGTKHYKFPGIGKLKLLQKVDNFVVKNETGYRIEELECMNDLRILGIKGLENVRDAQDACKAKLCDKSKLRDLSLGWKISSQNNMTDLDICARVLDNLQPRNNLKKLTMKNYMGVRSAKWMDNADLINSLEDINLDGCLEWQILPPFGQLPFLKSLRLYNMSKAERFDSKFYGNDLFSGFPSLVELSIDNVPQLCHMELPDLPPFLCRLNLRNLDNLSCLPCSLPTLSSLTLLAIGRVPQLRKLPDLPPSLCTLHLQNLDSLNCLPSSLPAHSSLVWLEISTVPQLRELPDLPPSLRYLNLDNLDNLNCLPSWLSSLTILSIVKVPRLQELPDLPPSLCSLKLGNLDNLSCLPSCLPTLSSLDDIFIDEVPQLQELPDLPPSLRKLNLHNLDNMHRLPSCLSTLSSLKNLSIINVPLLRELPDLPPSLEKLKIMEGEGEVM